MVVEPDEIKKIEPKTAKTMEILEFVKAGDVNPVFFESSYYMVPEEAGRRPFALLRKALDRIFAPEIDTHLIAAMPDYWQRYFEATASQKNETFDEAGVSAPTNVDQRARLIAPIEPASNDFAQNAGIAGMAMYHAVIDAAGKAGAIAVARPIGFGLDENAVEAIHQAKFEPAIKDGKAVPVWVDVIVQFRIYSKRTNVPGQPAGDAARQKTLPGPYSVGQQ